MMGHPGLKTHNIGTWFVLFGAFPKLMPRALTAWEEVLRPPGRDAGCLTLRLNYNFCLEPRRAVNPLPKNWVRADTLTSCLT